MTRRSLAAALSALALLGLLGLAPDCAAKPPDLPANQRITVAPDRQIGTFETTPGGSVRPKIDVLDNPADPDCTYKDLLITAQEARTDRGSIGARGGPGTRSPGPIVNWGEAAWRWLSPSEWRPLVSSLLYAVHPIQVLELAEEPKDPPAGRIDELETPPAPLTCPYLRQTADRHVRQLAEPETTCDVVTNLKRLEQAAEKFQEAKNLARAGQLGAALDCLAAVSRLAPGSSYDERVHEVMAELFGKLSGAGTSAGEGCSAESEGTGSNCRRSEEPGACQPCPKAQKMHANLPGVRQQVDGLMKACHLVMADGRYAKAAELAREAHALDPERVEADPLVYKLHLLEWKEDEECPADSGTGCGPACPKCPGCPSGPAPPGKTAAGKPGAALERKLSTPVTLNFDDAPLSQVLNDLRDFNAINIAIDKPALEEQGTSPDTPITMKLDQVSLKSALNLILHQVHLGYVIEDDVVVITTPQQIRRPLVTMTFAVGDLIEDAEASDLLCWKAPGDEALAKLIAATIDPRSWADMGGAGTIEFVPLSKSLVIDQTPDRQEQVADLIAALRRHLEQEKARARPTPKPVAVAPPEETLCPHLPPVDRGVVAALDAVLREMDVQGRPCGGSCAKPGETPCPEGGCPGDLLGALATWARQNCTVEVDVSWCGVRASCDIPVGGTTVHARYRGGLLSLWSSEAAPE